MRTIKSLLKRNKHLSEMAQKGMFSKLRFKYLFVNFLFQRIFRLNSDSPWSVHYTSTVIQPKKITVAQSSLRSLLRSPGCYIQAINGIEIGENVWWGPGVGMISANKDMSANYVGHLKVHPIILHDNVWIGMNSVILPGVELGKNVIVGAGSVVTKSFPADVVIAGNPAAVIKTVG